MFNIKIVFSFNLFKFNIKVKYVLYDIKEICTTLAIIILTIDSLSKFGVDFFFAKMSAVFLRISFFLS